MGTSQPPLFRVVNIIWVTNWDLFNQYRRQVPATLEPYGGKYIVRSEKPKVFHGSGPPPDFLVILEFPSEEAAEGWRTSDAYKSILADRDASATSWVVGGPEYVLPDA